MTWTPGHPLTCFDVMQLLSLTFEWFYTICSCPFGCCCQVREAVLSWWRCVTQPQASIRLSDDCSHIVTAPVRSQITLWKTIKEIAVFIPRAVLLKNFPHFRFEKSHVHIDSHHLRVKQHTAIRRMRGVGFWPQGGGPGRAGDARLLTQAGLQGFNCRRTAVVTESWERGTRIALQLWKFSQILMLNLWKFLQMNWLPPPLLYHFGFWHSRLRNIKATRHRSLIPMNISNKRKLHSRGRSRAWWGEWGGQQGPCLFMACYWVGWFPTDRGKWQGQSGRIRINTYGPRCNSIKN